MTSSVLRVDATSYLVCATQRSGSTLLCEQLKGTDVAGVPDEYFEELRLTGLPRQPRQYFESPHVTHIAETLHPLDQWQPRDLPSVFRQLPSVFRRLGVGSALVRRGPDSR